jgi:hypothetical protein
MDKKIYHILIVLFIVAVFAPIVIGFPIKVAASATFSNVSYAIDWWTVDGGGGVSDGGEYTLQGTIGQPDAGSINGGDYTLDGGFWVESILDFLEYLIHLPLVLK